MDKTKVNLERLRACDAGWEENKHPRAENGQFTSGSGSAGGKNESQLRKAAKIIQGKGGEPKGYKGLSFKEKTSEADSGTPAGEIHNFIVGNLNGEKPTKENVEAACKLAVNMLNDNIAYMQKNLKTAKQFGLTDDVKAIESNIKKHEDRIQAAFDIASGLK